MPCHSLSSAPLLLGDASAFSSHGYNPILGLLTSCRDCLRFLLAPVPPFGLVSPPQPSPLSGACLQDLKTPLPSPWPWPSTV